MHNPSSFPSSAQAKHSNSTAQESFLVTKHQKSNDPTLTTVPISNELRSTVEENIEYNRDPQSSELVEIEKIALPSPNPTGFDKSERQSGHDSDSDSDDEMPPLIKKDQL